MRRSLRSLRGRVTLIALATVAVALAATGAVLVSGVGRDARRGVDADLQRRVASVLGPRDGVPVAAGAIPDAKLPPKARELLRTAKGSDRLALKRKLAATAMAKPGSPPARLDRQNLLLGSGVYARVIVGGTVVKQAGDIGAAPVSLPRTAGYATVTAGGQSLRTLTVNTGGTTLQLSESLAPALARVTSTRRLVIALSAVGLTMTGLAVGLLAGLALRPVQRLRRGAARVSTTRDLSVRLDEGHGPAEVDALAAAVNAMLARLAASSRETELALMATRRFAADAGHELRTPLTAAQANLEALRRNPGIDHEERRRIIDEIAADHRRLVDLLAALQALARGDAASTLPREQVNVADVLDAAVVAARRRHPRSSIRVVECPEQAHVDGWPEGIRILIDNLLQNVAVHAGPHARADVSLRAGATRLSLTVDDDGPGVRESERALVFERFARGASARGPGSGLGLALVAQQASLHGGTAEISDSPLGGARFEICLPRSHQAEAPRAPIAPPAPQPI